VSGAAVLATGVLELARSDACNDLLATIDRLAALLGADASPTAEPYRPTWSRRGSGAS
jgi:hypothetical protein